ncbi:unnamed protein product [Prorocentrum cordatum]|uniref:Uncharacterized protein n=1 Tax=Prorocentrum cordatum TaxID=2364126 RepID=A0ABN9W6W8_9DINO|nr:unnamed protein product [Polarella glacialis]
MTLRTCEVTIDHATERTRDRTHRGQSGPGDEACHSHAPWDAGTGRLAETEEFLGTKDQKSDDHDVLHGSGGAARRIPRFVPIGRQGYALCDAVNKQFYTGYAAEVDRLLDAAGEMI